MDRRRIRWAKLAVLLVPLALLAGCADTSEDDSFGADVPRVVVQLAPLAAGLNYPAALDLVETADAEATGTGAHVQVGEILVANAGLAGAGADSIVVIEPATGTVRPLAHSGQLDLHGDPGVSEPQAVHLGGGYVWAANRAGGRGSLAALDTHPGTGWDGPTGAAGEPVAGPTGRGVFGGDDVGLQVIAIEPEPDEVSVPVTTVIRATFSQPLAREEVNESRFYLVPGEDGHLEISADSRQVTFIPDQPLEPGEEYRINISSTIEDIYGNSLDGDPRSPGFEAFESYFTTYIDPFFVTYTDPGCSQSGVPTDLAEVVVHFNKPVRDTAMSSTNFKLFGPDGDSLSGDRQVHEDGLAARLVIDASERPLQADSHYTIFVSHNAQSVDGNDLDQHPGGWPDNFACSFFTGVPPGYPEVVLTDPADGETGVSVSPEIMVIFSADVRVPEGAVTLTDGGGVPVALERRTGDDYLTSHVWQSGLLERNRSYTLRVSTAVTDREGRSLRTPFSAVFSTEEYSNPRVTGVTPADGAAGVATNSLISVNFSEEVNCATVTAGSFYLDDLAGGERVPATIACHGDFADLSPIGELAPNTAFRVWVTTDVTDEAGFPLDQTPGGALDAFSSTFTTASGPDPDPPAVVGVEPADGADDIFIGTVIQVRFSEPMDSSSLNFATYTLDDGTQEVTGERYLAEGGVVAVLVPGELLAENRLYTITVDGSVRDTQGQPMGSTFTSIFTTGSGRVLLNEVVTDPQQDWNDDTPFDAIPGTGTVSDADEWIEIYNATSGVIDISDWTLAMIDTTPVDYTLGSGASGVIERFFGSGISTLAAFQPGDYLVVGNPPGAVNNASYLQLKDALGKLVDDVELGDDPEGDGDGDGAPDGNATGIPDESVARVPNGVDTDVDGSDWEHAAATIGGSNGGTGGGRGRPSGARIGDDEPAGLGGVAVAGPAFDEPAAYSTLVFASSLDQGRILYLDWDDGLGVLAEGFDWPAGLVYVPGEQPGRGVLWCLDIERRAVARIVIAASGPVGGAGTVPVLDGSAGNPMQFFAYSELDRPVGIARSARSGDIFVACRGNGTVVELDPAGLLTRIYETGAGVDELNGIDVGDWGEGERVILALTGGPNVDQGSGPAGRVMMFSP